MTQLQNGIILNDIQEQGLFAGKDFLKSDRLFFTLSGSAGSGKTTLSQAILEGVQDVIVTAPTHKAKKVVSRSSGYRGETIQKILGMRPDVLLENFSQKNILFSMSGKSLLEDYRVIMIDEASMLNKDMVDLIKVKCKENNVKAIFLGDPRQLPPVKESTSAVFTDKEIEQFRLTKVERQQAGNPLITLYDKILKHIDRIDYINEQFLMHNKGEITLSFMDIDLYEKELESIPFDRNSDMNEDGVGYKFFTSKIDFYEAAKPCFKIGEDLDNKLIAWTNNCVYIWNNKIRQGLLSNHHLQVQQGELIMAHQSLTDKNNWNHVIYENSADYMITSVKEGFKTAENHDKSKRANIDGYFVNIEDLEYGLSEQIFVISKICYEQFAAIEQDYSDFAKNAINNKKWAWKSYFDFKNDFCLIGDIKQGDKVIVKKDFDFGYSITAHKSQGSTYENVFVELDDIMRNPNPAERWRLAYVALSRPKKGAYILWS